MNDHVQAAHSIGEEVNLFVRHVDSLRETLPMTMMVMQLMGDDLAKKLEAFEGENCTVAHVENGRKVSIPLEHIRRWNRMKSKHDQVDLARKLIPRSILVSLVSQYDAFLGRLLRMIFLSRPELLNASERTLTFAQAASFDSIEAMREHVIEKEVEGVLRSSHADHFKWMENRFSVTLTKGVDIWPQFIELTERRNLFVHADGVVSNNYLTTCKQNGVALDPLLHEGTPLGVPQDYFVESYRCIFELGMKLAHVLWRKLLPDEREAADSNLIAATYELIEREEYPIAITLLTFACETIKNHASEWHLLAFVVNRAQAFKWSGKEADCLRVLEKYDWSAKGDEFKIADAVLRGEWLKSAEIMQRIGSNGPVKKLNYRDWPLFREFRLRSEFLTAYEQVFGEPFPSKVTADTEQSPREI